MEQPAQQGAPAGHVRLCRLCAATVLLVHQVRERHRLAELLGAAAQRHRRGPRRHLRHAAGGGALPPLRRPSRPRVQ
ncbi:hypothetical protein G6F22_012475 [Rhizopus arrhizus]|nr:hypothetical protein G6F22_012475 [Rhizopus arrhizus]